jgi:predicted kinase
MLLLLNGAPGVGKSALADFYADRQPGTLVIEIDDLRRSIPGWEAIEESKVVARDLTLELAQDHLGRGEDVVIPQFLGRREFVDQLRAVAESAGTRFVEVVLHDDVDTIIERFRQRRRELAAAGVRHPEADLSDDAIAPEIAAANENLRALAADFDLPVIEMGAGVQVAYESLCAKLPR